MTKIDVQINEAKRLLASLIKRKNGQLASKTIKCASCGTATKIKDIDLISVESYTEPHGCTGGDYWSHSEYNYVCPHCSIRNRFLFSDTYYKIKWSERANHNPELYFFREYRRLFKSVTSQQEKVRNFRFVNNYYIEKNLKRFIGNDKVKELEKYHGSF